MAEKGEQQRRPPARVWRAEAVPTEPVAQVTDPALRAILLIRRRGLLMEAAEIARRCGLASDDEAAALTG